MPKTENVFILFRENEVRKSRSYIKKKAVDDTPSLKSKIQMNLRSKLVK